MLRWTINFAANTVFFQIGFFGAVLGTGVSLVAQENYSQSFESIAKYAASVRALKARVFQQVELKEQLITESVEARKRLIASEQDLLQIQSQSIVQSMRLMENQYWKSLAQLDVNIALENSLGKSANSKGPTATSLRNSTAVVQVAMVDSLNLNEQAKQLDLASQLTIERRQKILSQLQQLVIQAQALLVEEQKLSAILLIYPMCRVCKAFFSGKPRCGNWNWWTKAMLAPS